MQKPEAVVTAIMKRWASGQLSREQLLKQLQGCGWRRWEVCDFLDRSDAERRASEERAKPAERRRDFQAWDRKPGAPRDFEAERRAGLESHPAAAEALAGWSREEVTLVELLGQLQAAGWSRREVYGYLEREADAMAGRQSLGNRPKRAGLRN